MLEQWQLTQRQNLPLEVKILMSQRRITEWYRHYEGKVYVSFSGGKDSTVLLHLVRSMFPDVPAVFIDTGLEFPEIREFVNTIPDVIVVRPKIPFTEVIEKHGFPVVSKEVSQKIREIRTTKSTKLLDKRMNGDAKGNGKLPEKWKYLIQAPFKISDRCCYELKKNPVHLYEKETGRVPFIATMAVDSLLRATSYKKSGCNSFTGARPKSLPMAFWREQDVWDYIKQNELPYSSIYDKGYTRTGCMFCAFGVHLEKHPNRFEQMEQTHPAQYRYCMDRLGLREVIEYMKKE